MRVGQQWGKKAADLKGPEAVNEPAVILSSSGPFNGFDRVRLARQISWVLHPFLTAPLSILLILYLDQGELWVALGWAALCAAFVVGPALLYLRRKLKSRHYSDADISVREHRYSFYLFGGSCMIVCFGVLLWLGAPRILLTCFLTALVGVGVFALINRRWTKLSIHTGMMTALTVMVIFYSLPLALLLALGTLLVAWSRLVLQRHTLNQAILGSAVAILCVLLVFLPLTWF